MADITGKLLSVITKLADTLLEAAVISYASVHSEHNCANYCNARSERAFFKFNNNIYAPAVYSTSSGYR